MLDTNTIVICFSSFLIHRALAQGECTDVRGRQIAHGLHYVPGPDTCSLCICDNGHARVCKAVLCSQPQDCRSFRVGSTCCEYICLDDVVKPADGGDANIRVAASGAALIVMLTVALVVYRVKRQKRRRSNHADDQRSLTSIGYISGSMAYVGGTCETGMSAWKPPTNYMPRGEPPPPYDEVVAQTRLEAMRLNSPPFHRSYSAAVEAMTAMARTDDPSHQYANIARPVTQMPNTQGCYNAPLLQPAHPPEPMNPVYHHIPPNNGPSYGPIRLTGSLGAITGRGVGLLQRCSDHDRRNLLNLYNNNNNLPVEIPPAKTAKVNSKSKQKKSSARAETDEETSGQESTRHRTIPRISTVIDTIALDTSVSFIRNDRSHNEIRRSFHKPSDPRPMLAETGRSMPRNLNLASSNLEPEIQIGNVRAGNVGRSRIHSEEQPAPSESSPAPLAKPTTSLNKMAANTDKLSIAPEFTSLSAQTSLPLTIDKPSCVCSYESEAAPTEEADDYRSECENCKSASSSRWVLEEGWSEVGSEGTQTLQRRAPPPAPPPRANCTLPQPPARTSRNVMGPPSNWENWFNTIPDSDTESEEE